jgi:hypothetical protein
MIDTPALERKDAAEVWRACFHQWPAGVPQRGVLVTTFAEQVPFASFMVTDDLLYLERRTPDNLGARAIIVPFANIAGLKITEVVEARDLRALGFKTVSASRPARAPQPPSTTAAR